MKNIVDILLAVFLMGSQYTFKNENVYFQYFNEDSISINFDDYIYEVIEIADSGADATALCTISFDVFRDGQIANIVVESNCDFCNNQVEIAVIKSAPYWHIRDKTKSGKVVHSFKYKFFDFGGN